MKYFAHCLDQTGLLIQSAAATFLPPKYPSYSPKCVTDVLLGCNVFPEMIHYLYWMLVLMEQAK